MESKAQRGPRAGRGDVSTNPLWKQWLFCLCAVGVATAALFFIQSGQSSYLDSDTYGRIAFIENYQPQNTAADAHILYHHLLAAAIHLPGVTPERGVFLLTALFFALFLATVFWVCRQHQLSVPNQRLIFWAVTLGSPGLVSLFYLAEDNVAYFPILFLLFHLLLRPAAEVRSNVKIAVLCGVLVALGMLLSVTVLVFLGLVVVVPFALIAERTDVVLRIGITIAVALAVYYLAHALLFPGCAFALNDYAKQAIDLKDYTASATDQMLRQSQSYSSEMVNHVPRLFSLERMHLYLGGLRSISIAPTLHTTSLYEGDPAVLVNLGFARLGLTELILFVYALGFAATVVAIGVWFVRQGGGARESFRQRPMLWALVAIAFGFPYAYEPHLIERWDIGWLLLLYLLVRGLASGTLPAVLRNAVIAMLLLQSVGSVALAANHYGLLFRSEELTRFDSLARQARESNACAAVESIDDFGRGETYFAYRSGIETRIVISTHQDSPTFALLLPYYFGHVELDVARTLLHKSCSRFFVFPSVSNDIQTLLEVE